MDIKPSAKPSEGRHHDDGNVWAGDTPPTSIGWLVPLVLAYLVVPLSLSCWFDGLPFDHAGEFALVTLISVTMWKEGRDCWRRVLSPTLVRGCTLVLLVGIILKIWLSISGIYTGFLGCYRGGTTTSTACEASFANPLRRFDATRIDDRIDFTAERWPADFLNSRQFDRDHRDDDWMPPVAFSAAWRTVAQADAAASLAVRYRGEAAITIDSLETVWPADYLFERQAAVMLPPGLHTVTIAYAFHPPEHCPQSSPSRCEAVMVIDSDPAVRWGTATTAHGVVAGIVDAVGLCACAVLLYLCGGTAPKQAGTAALILGACVGVGLLPIAVSVRDEALKIMVIAIALYWILRHRPPMTIVVPTIVTMFAIRIALVTGPAPGVVYYRGVSDDPLTYESFAHAVLSRWSLRAGEDVFFYQPLFRYLRFLERLVLGPTEWPIVVVASTGLFATFAWLTRRALTYTDASDRGAVLAVASVLLWIVSGATGSIAGEMSEYPTWIGVPLAAGLLLMGETRREWMVGVALLTISALIRFNQLPADATILAAFAYRRLRRDGWSRDWLVCLTPLIALIGVPLAHNGYYGRTWTWLPRSHDFAGNLTLPVSALWHLHNPAVRTQLLEILQYLAHVGIAEERTRAIPLHFLQAAYVGAAVLWWRRSRGFRRLDAGLVLLLPAITLAVHLFFAVDVYYPRHIVLGYLLMGVAFFIVASWTAASQGGNLRAR